tara:strand:- start:19813 stop:20979 length:1167 start_codon:yes stop_codon:yes gene_type:complete
MKFAPYEDVPLFLSVNGGSGEYIFAESASISVDQPLKASRQLDDNVIQICQFGLGEDMDYQSPTFQADTTYNVCLGPTKGPPRPLATSIHHIPSGTKVSFPNGKHLYFNNDVSPDYDDYLIELHSKSGNWTLSEGEAQSGYFEPIFDYVSEGAVQGNLNVSFYLNTGNLQSFFNVTGLSNPSAYPPIDEERITGFIGDFKFSHAYLSSLSFSLSPSAISQATASFSLFGQIEKDSSLSENYYASDLYQQQSIPHGEDSEIVGHSNLGLNHPISFDYNITVERVPRYVCPTGVNDAQGLVPVRVSKKSTNISMSIEGDNIDPNILAGGFNGKRANLSARLSDLNYQNFEDNSNGFLHQFNCSGIINSQSLSVNSAGYLNGSISVFQNYS